MKKQLGNFVVLFRPGVVTGIHNEREIALRNICEKLGGLDCKVFDPYAVYVRGEASESLNSFPKPPRRGLTLSTLIC